jgi:hypothetical protein
MNRTLISLLVSYWILYLLQWLMASALGDAPADALLQKLFDQSRARAENIQVGVALGGATVKPKLLPDPVMKYTDVPRRIEMATLWVWHDDGRPVALGKVEAYRREGGPKWLYCFASASDGFVDGQWPDGRRFQAGKPGIEWTALKGPVPQTNASGRRRQMKELFQRFTATVTDDGLKTSDDLRPLARPLHEYSSPRHGVAQGILCGFTANGTNPDVLIALEAVGEAGETTPPRSWRYGVVCMTSTGVSVKLDRAEVFTRPFTRGPGDRDNWTFFWEKTPTK